MELLYKSTRNANETVTASEAILKGLADDGGLFVPVSIPKLDVTLDALKEMSYQETAYVVMKQFLTDFTEEELKDCINKAYDAKFDTEEIAPLAKVENTYYLELFHGATIAFKDMALSILPHLLTTSARKNNVKNEIVILTATSGDTGKAALEGYKDIDRIIEMRISPVNVSVHTTNPELRCKMRHNKRAGETLSYLYKLSDNGINICAQIVLCREVNDGVELERSLNDLAKLGSRLVSVAVVPSGLTSFRENLYPLKTFDKESASKVIKTVESVNKRYRNEFKRNLFFCSDEFYLLANKKLPKNSYYEEYSQLENGVGMLRSFDYELEMFLKTLSKEEKQIERSISIATGASAFDFICESVKKIQKKCKKIKCNVYKVENDFFGHTITVAGLITGKDLISQLKNKKLGEELLISRNMLRSEGDLFLCNSSLEDVEKGLGVRVTPVMQDGASFAMAVLGIKEV